MIRSIFNIASKSNKSASRKVKSAVANVSVIEPLEGRQMMSASVAADGLGASHTQLAQAVSIGDYSVKTTRNVNGAVGDGVNDAIYSVNVASSLDLNVKLTNLKQSDTVKILFADGKTIGSVKTAGKTAQLTQRLDPGTYYVDISTGLNAAKGAKRVKAVDTTPFKMTVKGLKSNGSTAPVESNSQGLGALGGAAAEPGYDSQYAVGYQDFSSDPLFGPNGPTADDINQGANGDCYFLATLSDIARNDPGLIEQDIQATSNGDYKVKFENNGTDTWVTVDPSFPVDGYGNLAYAKLGSGNSIWVPIVEKAFCYFRDPSNISYQAIAGGWSEEAFADFGSTDATALKNTQAANGQAVVTQISQWIQEGRMVTLGTQQTPTTLVDLHMYSVVQVNSDGTIELRNPWGCNPIDPHNLQLGNNQDGG
ncbi:MAG TPA: C2 family cysteine protease, partial [Humisphaera sp.]|nr:C2 family cysteine protease [Humisphaera sp.]